MGFYNDPIVDENSKRSEESVNAVKSLFTRKNGFISREEIPDYGVDFDVELSTMEGATSKKFAIQIKSTILVKSVVYNKDLFISLQFKTSRLGYLARREPAYGIIIIYDETSQTCYYDYVEDIISRLDGIDARDGWREQESVAILIPFKIITIPELQLIHKKFMVRHENSHLMLREHGLKFDIPTLASTNQKNENRLNVDDPAAVADFLEKFGSILYNEHRFGHVLTLLGKVNKQRILDSPELIFISAITYTQSGNIVEAEYYIRKALKLEAIFTSEQNGIIAFSQIRIEFLKGNIDRSAFTEKLKKLSSSTDHTENKLVIDINVLFFELASNMASDAFTPDIIERIIAVSKCIEDAGLTEEKKHQLKVFHSENMHNYAIQVFINSYNKNKLKDKLGIDVSYTERLSTATMVNALTNTAEEITRNAYKFSIQKRRPLLKASAAHQLGKNFLSHRSTLFMLVPEDKMDADRAKMTEMYSDFHSIAIIGYNGYLDLKMFQNAHEALTVAFEIQKLCLLATGNVVGPLSSEHLIKIIREIESEYDLQPFESAIDLLAAFNSNESKDPITILLEADDEMLVDMAKKFLVAAELPESRLTNIVNSMKMRKIFHERCSNPNIELLEDMRHAQNYSTHYIVVPPCILRDKKTNRRSKPSADIEVLLLEFSDIISGNITDSE